MDVRVLGPMSVREKAGELILSAGKPRQLLALLLLNESHPVTADALISELWDEAPPRSVMTTLQTHIMRLRRAFAQGLGLDPQEIAQRLLQTRDGGYQLNLGDVYFDLREFRRLQTAGHTRLHAGDSMAASRLFTEALAQWRGPALVDVEQGRLLRAAVARLDESRLETLTLFFAAQLDVGRHREMLSELAELVVRHPCHEALHAQFMIALYRSGHRARALAAFEELSRNLRTELGVAPSGRLTRLRHAVQVSDTAALERETGCAPPDDER